MYVVSRWLRGYGSLTIGRRATVQRSIVFGFWHPRPGVWISQPVTRVVLPPLVPDLRGACPKWQVRGASGQEDPRDRQESPRPEPKALMSCISRTGTRARTPAPARDALLALCLLSGLPYAARELRCRHAGGLRRKRRRGQGSVRAPVATVRYSTVHTVGRGAVCVSTVRYVADWPVGACDEREGAVGRGGRRAVGGGGRWARARGGESLRGGSLCPAVVEGCSRQRRRLNLRRRSHRLRRGPGWSARSPRSSTTSRSSWSLRCDASSRASALTLAARGLLQLTFMLGGTPIKIQYSRLYLTHLHCGWYLRTRSGRCYKLAPLLFTRGVAWFGVLH